MWPPHPQSLEDNSRPHPLAWKLGGGAVALIWLAGSIMSLELQQVSGPFMENIQIAPLEIPLSGGAASFDPQRATDLLVEVVVQLESQGDPMRVGTRGERGLMQLRAETWAEVTRRHFGEEIPFDRAFEPLLNRQVGRLYLGDLQEFLYQHKRHWKSDLRSLLLAAYNAGPERLRQARFRLGSLPASTRDYAQRGSALHDWLLEDMATGMREALGLSARE